MSRPDSYMPLFTARWLRATMHLSAQERDAYMLLSIEYWDRGGPLPNDNAKLGRIARCTSKQWLSVKESIKEFFEECIEDGAPIWRHTKLDEWICEAERKYALAKERSTAGNAARWGNRSSKQSLKDTDKDSASESQLKRETNKAKALGGSRPRDPSGAVAPPPKVVDASWNGKQAVLAGKIGDSNFLAYFGDTKLTVGPPAEIEVSTEARREMIGKKFGPQLRTIFGQIEITVAKDMNT